jgi:hypothetical protein
MKEMTPMLDYLAYVESQKWMRQSVSDRPETNAWRGINARPQATGTVQFRHGLASALRGVAARVDPVAA